MFAPLTLNFDDAQHFLIKLILTGYDLSDPQASCYFLHHEQYRHVDA